MERVNVFWNCIVLAGSKEDFHALENYGDESADDSRGGSVDISEGSSFERRTHYHESNFTMETLQDHKSCSDNKFKAEGMDS